jgi:hypothetical protein
MSQIPVFRRFWPIAGSIKTYRPGMRKTFPVPADRADTCPAFTGCCPHILPCDPQDLAFDSDFVTIC